MKRLTDCGDNSHDAISDIDSYGNSIIKCKKCGNRLYNKGGEVPTATIGGSSYATAMGTTSVGYQSGYSIDKPEQMDHLSTMGNYSSMDPYA